MSSIPSPPTLVVLLIQHPADAPTHTVNNLLNLSMNFFLILRQRAHTFNTPPNCPISFYFFWLEKMKKALTTHFTKKICLSAQPRLVQAVFMGELQCSLVAATCKNTSGCRMELPAHHNIFLIKLPDIMFCISWLNLCICVL